MPGNPFYWSPAWLALRARHLRGHPWCVVCAQLGMRVRAVEVDHVKAERLGGGRMAPENLQSLCRTHHSQKTAHSPEAGAYRSPRSFTVTGPDGYPVPAGTLPTPDDPEE